MLVAASTTSVFPAALAVAPGVRSAATTAALRPRPRAAPVDFFFVLILCSFAWTSGAVEDGIVRNRFQQDSHGPVL
jgi:hypothetical protein